jgi:hypothetical protein
MQEIIYHYGKIYGAIHPTIFLLGRSTHPRDGERGRGSSPEDEAMEEGGLSDSNRPGEEGGHRTAAGGLCGGGDGWVIVWEERDAGGKEMSSCHNSPPESIT